MVWPAEMRGAVLRDVDDIRIETVPLPDLGPGDLLVRTAASGICSGDLMPWYVRRKAPFVFGHEPAGTVVALGAGTDPTLLGARVFAHHHAPCFACPYCDVGDHVQCATWRATFIDPGGMAEYFRVPRPNVSDVQVLPDELSFVAGSLIEPLACVVKSIARGAGLAAAALPEAREELAGRTAYVVGLGVMGLMHVCVLAALGARVFASDFVAQRQRKAEELGATAFDPAEAEGAVREATPRDGADIVVCGPGSATALEHAVAAAGRGATIVMFTPLEPGVPFALDQSEAYFRDLSLVASYSCGPGEIMAASRLLAQGVVTPETIGVTTVNLEAVPEAYQAMRSGAILKAVALF